MRKIKTILLVILIFVSSMLFASCEAITAQNIIYNKTSDVNGNQNTNNRPGVNNNTNTNSRPSMNANPGTDRKTRQ